MKNWRNKPGVKTWKKGKIGHPLCLRKTPKAKKTGKEIEGTLNNTSRKGDLSILFIFVTFKDIGLISCFRDFYQTLKQGVLHVVTSQYYKKVSNFNCQVM